jgi:hypothetical protein
MGRWGRRNSDWNAYCKYLDYLDECREYEEEYGEDTYWEDLLDEYLKKQEEEQFNFTMSDEYYTEMFSYSNKPDRHIHIIKGVKCTSGRTVRPVGRGNGAIIPNRFTDNSKQHPSRLLRVRKVRQCDCCRTHRCKNNIPIRGRKIKVTDYMENE